jgi:hypothetical protein
MSPRLKHCFVSGKCVQGFDKCFNEAVLIHRENSELLWFRCLLQFGGFRVSMEHLGIPSRLQDPVYFTLCHQNKWHPTRLFLLHPHTLLDFCSNITHGIIYYICATILLVLPKIRITHFIVNIKLTPFHGVTRLRHGNVYASLKIVIAVSFAEPGANATFIK